MVEGLPTALDALFVTSDLQGWTPLDAGHPRLMGMAVADALGLRCWACRLSPKRVGVLLAGDLFAPQDLARLGGFGDCREVWRSFAANMAFAIGVAGNHDDFGGSPWNLLSFCQEPHVHLHQQHVRSCRERRTHRREKLLLALAPLCLFGLPMTPEMPRDLDAVYLDHRCQPRCAMIEHTGRRFTSPGARTTGATSARADPRHRSAAPAPPARAAAWEGLIDARSRLKRGAIGAYGASTRRRKRIGKPSGAMTSVRALVAVTAGVAHGYRQSRSRGDFDCE